MAGTVITRVHSKANKSERHELGGRVKGDKEMTSADVQGKPEAASRWANHVSADDQVGVRWNYLLVSEADVEAAKGSWEALKRLGQ